MEVIETDAEGERFHTIPEVARILRVSDQSVRRWIKAGELLATKPGKEYRIRQTDLEEFLKAREPRPKPPALPSPEQPNFNGLLDEEQRHIRLEEIRESYRETRDGVEDYLTRWERWLETGGVPEEAVREFLVATRAWYPTLRDLLIDELTAISHVLDIEPEPYLPDEAKAESSLLPLVDRYGELGRKLTEIWNERPPEEPPADFETKWQERRSRSAG